MANSTTIMKENIVEEVSLTNQDDFVKINKLYYGGLQKWLYTEGLKSKFYANRSCGVTAVCNSLVHMAMYRKGLEGTYRYPGLSRGEFSKFMLEAFSYLKPRPWGIANLRKIEKATKAFAEFKGISLDSKSLSKPKRIEDTINFIKEGLLIDSPILMLTWNSKIKNLKYHWVTITGYIRNKEGKYYIITSNWGRKEIFSLDKWVKENSLNKGLIYFY